MDRQLNGKRNVREDIEECEVGRSEKWRREGEDCGDTAVTDGKSMRHRPATIGVLL